MEIGWRVGMKELTPRTLGGPWGTVLLPVPECRR